MVFLAIFLFFQFFLKTMGYTKIGGFFFENYNYESQDSKSLFLFFITTQHWFRLTWITIANIFYLHGKNDY